MSSAVAAGAVAPVVIVGPTASGKSDVAMAWCRRSPRREILAVDSMQVYRGMDIGTATPSAQDRAAVTHHGLDLVDPGEEFTVAEFAAAARGVVADVAARGAELVLVAGTGLYLRAVIDPLEIPGRFPEVRAVLHQRVASEGVRALYAELVERDPRAAERIEPDNVRRVVRALEVTIGSGRAFSSYGPGLAVYPPSAVRQFGLRWSRAALRERIAARVHAMIAAGFVAEVETLARAPMSRTAAQALGYREILAHLAGECSLDEAVETTVRRTQQFAVRQERWFRRDPRIRWIDITCDAAHEALAVLEDEARP